MTIRLRVFLGIALIAGLAAWQLFDNFRDQLKPAVQQVTEDMLVETGVLLAPIAEADMRTGRIHAGNLADLMSASRMRVPDARIWNQHKVKTDVAVYVTDASGRVVYDSQGLVLGQDFYRWNDVYLALQGRYGARSTKRDPQDRASTVMYVATPLRDGERIIGVLTASKPVNSLQPFIALGERALSRQALIVLLLAILLAMAFAWWVSRGVEQLVVYAGALARGQRPSIPATGSAELDQLALAMEDMRHELDGKRYIENYIQSMTHELKSPLTAIRATAELLEADMPAVDRLRFVHNLQNESRRVVIIVDRLLELARLEQRRLLDELQDIDIAILWADVCRSSEVERTQRNIHVDSNIELGLSLRGDRFLLGQALLNLLENALSFSPSGGSIHFDAQEDNGVVVMRLRDEGPGIPDYAHARVFERFFSLPRPEGGSRRTGLGLPLVREIASLHGGSVSLRNAETGCEAMLKVPVRQGMLQTSR